MKTNLVRNLVTLFTTTLLINACSSAATADSAAIATSAVQTVEARYTTLANQIPSETPAPMTNTPSPQATAAPAATQATSTPQPVDGNGKACYTAIFIEDVSIPDGMLVNPGSTFTKKWRVENAGNCTWDSTYSLSFANGDAMGATTNIPLTETVGPGENTVLAVDLTAPSTNGLYTGYWRIATPFGGTFGVGYNDQSLIVQVEVSDKPNRDEGISGIDIGLYQRVPANGCNANGAVYTFSAVVTANTAIAATYHWNRHPDDGSKPEGGKLNFTTAGSKTITFTWTFQKEAIQDIDRWVTLSIDNPTPQTSERIHFTFTCQE